MSYFCLGVRIDEVEKREALEQIRAFLNENGQKKIFTPNPEMLMEAHKNPEFAEILNRGNLNVCDGIGLALVSSGRLKRIPGTDLMIDICAFAEEQESSVYFIGGGANAQFRQEMRRKFPELKFTSNTGPELQGTRYKVQDPQSKESIQIIDDINKVKPSILFVGFGHGKQEWWIDTYLKEMPSVKVAMGVGGAFDFVSGKATRAPKIFRMVGLEWLWRLILEPKRIKRIWRAVFRFPILFLGTQMLRTKEIDTNQ